MALKTEQNQKTVYERIAEIYVRLEDKERAKTHYLKALEFEPEDEQLLHKIKNL